MSRRQISISPWGSAWATTPCFGDPWRSCFQDGLGLCVGHDSLFYQYSEARVTTLVVKDRVLAHNPVGAIYCADGYFKNRLKIEE